MAAMDAARAAMTAGKHSPSPVGLARSWLAPGWLAGFAFRLSAGFHLGFRLDSASGFRLLRF